MDSLIAIAVGTLMGSLSRLYMLRIDYRQYPSFPQGYTIHLSLGIIASFLGAVAVPALLTGNYAAATFLGLAATQFRDVRNLERESLSNLEDSELVPRGLAYIEGIARVFEARNYLAGWTAVLASMTTQFSFDYGLPGYTSVPAGVGLGLLGIAMMNRAIEGQTVGKIARVRSAEIEFHGPLLTVEGIFIMNVGSSEARKTYLEHGMAVMIEPKDANAKATLSNVGQRQAIVHDTAALMGVRMDVGEQEFTPLIRRHPDTGSLALTLVPVESNRIALLQAVRNVPVLEASVRKPLSTSTGKLAELEEVE